MPLSTPSWRPENTLPVPWGRGQLPHYRKTILVSSPWASSQVPEATRAYGCAERTYLVSSRETCPDFPSTMILQWSPDTSLLPGNERSQPKTERRTHCMWLGAVHNIALCSTKARDWKRGPTLCALRETTPNQARYKNVFKDLSVNAKQRDGDCVLSLCDSPLSGTNPIDTCNYTSPTSWWRFHSTYTLSNKYYRT